MSADIPASWEIAGGHRPPLQFKLRHYLHSSDVDLGDIEFVHYGASGIHDRTLRKKERTSSTNGFGCSRQAKCPPFSIFEY